MSGVNLFELVGRLTHPEKRAGWEETTAYFIGESRASRRTKSGYYPMLNTFSGLECLEYKICYYVEGKEHTGWYLFFPGPDPDPEEMRGSSMRIRYKKSRPEIFEYIPEPEKEE